MLIVLESVCTRPETHCQRVGAAKTRWQKEMVIGTLPRQVYRHVWVRKHTKAINDLSSTAMHTQQYFIGWDVGGWNCDRNPNSRDALVILNPAGALVGAAWRGNLARTISDAESTRDWICALFALCKASTPPESAQITLAIDTPLGFPEAFTRLTARLEHTDPGRQNEANPYLFRQTERYLFEHGLKPLSPVKDMIGSQATKGMHVLARFAPRLARCGVWTDAAMLTAIEAYPAPCKRSRIITTMLAKYGLSASSDPEKPNQTPSIDHQDKKDALICALIARLFVLNSGSLLSPLDDTPIEEGWIWLPRDALTAQQVRPTR